MIKITDYLSALGSLPKTPYTKDVVSIHYSDFSLNRKYYETPLYGELIFVQSEMMVNNKRHYVWKLNNKVDINYKVDDIMFELDDVLSAKTLFYFLNKYDFKQISDGIGGKYYYIDFHLKIWAKMNNGRYDHVYKLNNEEVIESIFNFSLNQYSNGLPIFWD